MSPRRGRGAFTVVRVWWIGVLVVASCLVAVHASTTEAPRPAQAHPAPRHDTTLLQAGAKTHTAATARASLHAGERASTSRFHAMADRVGIDVQPHRVRRGRQDHHAEHDQQVMLGIVESVLHRQDEQRRHEPPRDGTHAEAMEAEFHLLNALMEKQSQIREYGEHSTERETIGGVSRKFLKQVTDNAVKNALHRIRVEHPHTPLHTTEPLHLYGVRSPYNGPKKPAYQAHSALYTDEALADPYLSRNADIDPIARATAFAERTRPQMVYRLGQHDSELLAEREVERNHHFQAAHHDAPHRRSPAHEARRSMPTPRPNRRKQNIPLPQQHNPQVRFQAAQPKAQHPAPLAPHAVPPPKTTVHEGKPKPASQKDGKVDAGAFLELDTKLSFEELQSVYLDELNAHADSHGDQPWYVHHGEGHVADSEMASAPLDELFDRFHGHEAKEEELAMLEVDSTVDAAAEAESEAEQMPLRELGILLGLNPNKKPAAPAATPTPAPAAKATPPPAAAPTNTPKLQPRFTQVHASAKAKATAQAKEEEAPGSDGLDAMVGAGEAYKPSSLKHPPPPPVPPPPPPPPPPKFSAE